MFRSSCWFALVVLAGSAVFNGCNSQTDNSPPVASVPASASASDPQVVGRTLKLSGRGYTVS